MFNYSNIISHGFANFRQILLAFCMIVGGYFRSANDETTTEPILSSNTEEKIKLLLKKNGINYLRFTSPIVVLSQILDLISLLTLKIKIIQDKDKYTLLKNIQNLLEKFDDFDDRSKLLKEYNKRFLNHYQKDKKIEEFIQSIKKDIKSISEKISSIVFNEKEEIEHLIEQIDIRIDQLYERSMVCFIPVANFFDNDVSDYGSDDGSNYESDYGSNYGSDGWNSSGVMVVVPNDVISKSSQSPMSVNDVLTK